MSSAFGRKKPAVQNNGPAPTPSWLPRTSDTRGAQEVVQAYYRITHTEPSRLERARVMRTYRLSA